MPQNKRIAADHSAAWKTALDQHATERIDLVGSITGGAINHFLDRHFVYDSGRYTFVLKRTFDAGGTPREFAVTITAGKALKVALPPFDARTTSPEEEALFGAGGWSELEPLPMSPGLTTPRMGGHKDPTPNVRLVCDSIGFQFRWPKLDGSGTWTFPPKPVPIKAVGEAVLALQQGQDGLTLHIQVLRMKFDPAAIKLLRASIERRVRRLPAAEQQLLAADDDAFRDLLVIALNIAATTFAPKLVKDLNVPVPTIAGHSVVPTMLEMNNKTAVVGVTLDRQQLAARAAALLQARLGALQLAVQADVNAAGGLEALVLKPCEPGVGRTVQPRSSGELLDLMPHTSAFIGSLTAPRPGGARSRVNPAVPNGLAVGADQSSLAALARGAMPTPVNDCTGWADLDVVRGRVCWWMHIFDPQVTINGTTVSGQVNIDIGGAIEACVRKFWDCSWKWDCGRLTLAVTGSPGIQLRFDTGAGISFRAKVIGGAALSTNLPWPFNDVIKALTGLVVQGIIAVVNSVAANIQFQILLPEFQLPEQNTKLVFSGVSPFPFNRSGNWGVADKTFIGFSVGVSAVKKS